VTFADKFRKKAIFESLAEVLEAQIRREGWKGLLPSGIDLAQQHNVSLPTVQKAVTLLIERRVLVSRGGKRRLGVVAGPPHPRAGGKVELLVLAAKPLSFYDSTIAMGMLQLAEELKARGDGYRFVDLSEKMGVARRKAAHAEVVRTRPTHCVLMSPDSHLYQGVARHPVRIASMFGNLRSKKVQRLGVQYGPLVEIAVGHLKELGHRRFFIPFLGRKVRLKVSLANIARVAKEQGVELGVEYSADVPTPERIEASLDKALASGCTALIFPLWHDFLQAIGYFARRGIAYPRDLSVVVLVGTPSALALNPAVACCLNQPDTIARQIQGWLASGGMDREVFMSVFRRTWQVGGSTGPVPPRAPR
jgi:DNA-binding LacI/PurR family transcriptional regulator